MADVYEIAEFWKRWSERHAVAYTDQAELIAMSRALLAQKAVVEAAVRYSELEQKANELAAGNHDVTEFGDAVRAQSNAYTLMMREIAAVRAMKEQTR